MTEKLSSYNKCKETNVILLKVNNELLETNKALLKNNEHLASELKLYKNKSAQLITEVRTLTAEKNNCKMKCETIIHEKDRIISEKQKYIDGCRTTFERLRDGKWFYKVEMGENGRIEIIHSVIPG